MTDPTTNQPTTKTKDITLKNALIIIHTTTRGTVYDDDGEQIAWPVVEAGEYLGEVEDSKEGGWGYITIPRSDRIVTVEPDQFDAVPRPDEYGPTTAGQRTEVVDQPRYLDVAIAQALEDTGILPAAHLRGSIPTQVANMLIEAMEANGVWVFLQEDARLEQLGDGQHYRCYPMTQDEAEALGRDTRFDSSQVKRPTDYPAWPVIPCSEDKVCVGDLLVVPSDDGDRVHVVTSIRTDWPANGNIATGAAHIIKWDGDSVRYEPGERARILAPRHVQVRVGWSPNSGAMRFSLDDPDTTGI